jgi:hypothetical protein
MTNVSQLPSTVNYPQLSATTLKQAADAANAAAIEVKSCFLQTRYLPSIDAKVSGLNSAINEAVFKLSESVNSQLQNIALNTDTLRSYQEELRQAPSSETQDILEDISTRAEIIVRFIRETNDELKRALTPMTGAVDRRATAGYLAQLEVEQQRLPIELQEIRERKATLDAKRKSLTEAMALLDAKGIAEIGKDAILTAQQLASLSMVAPEVAVVDTAIKLAQEALKRLQSTINYVGLSEARDEIRKQIDALLASESGKDESLRNINTKHALIAAAHDFDDQRQRYVAEFEKFIVAGQSFLDAYRSINAQDEQIVSQLAVDASALATLMNSAI